MGYIHRNEWLVYGLLVAAAVAVSLPLYPYKWHTFLHIAGAVVFLGNIIVTAAWMLMAERTRSINVIHFSAKAVIRADLLFTLPGVRVDSNERVCHGDCRLGRVGRVSRILLDICRPGAVYCVWRHMGGSAHPRPTPHGRIFRPIGLPRFAAVAVFSALHKWYFWGAIAIALPLVSLFLMVNKPDFS